MSQNEGEIFKVGAAMVVFGAPLLYKSFKRFRIARKVEDVGTIPAASAPQGLVELQGHAWPSEVIPSPIDGKSAVFYKLEIKREEGTGKNRRWVTVHEGESLQPFYLVDSSGTVLIHPQRAELQIKPRVVDWRSLNEGQKNNLIMLTRRQKPGFTVNEGVFFKDKIRVHEYVIHAGSPLYAMGNFRTVEDMQRHQPAPGLGHFFLKLMSLKKAPLAWLQKFDRNKDGKICYDESRVAYSEAAGELLKTGTDAGLSALPTQHVTELRCTGMLAHHEQHQLILADCHQHELLARVGSKNLLMLIGGALLVAAGICLVVYQFKG
jgi:hypothetical protein